MKIAWPSGIPETEFSLDFAQKMAARMAVSYMKYGPVMQAAGKIDEIACLKQRLAKYEETGNTEWLVDVANFAMIEFMHRGAAAFRATDSDESPGIKTTQGNQIHDRHTAEGSHFYRRPGD